jgi:hypothetical protein
MKISDVTCSHCGASYLLAESASVDGSLVDGSAGKEACKICGKPLGSWSDGKLRAFRLMLSPTQRYVRTPISPTLSP